MNKWHVLNFRFNELYGWDSFFMAKGLMASEDPRQAKLALGTVQQLLYEIRHYGKVLNGNRSYYLNRSQPPFTTAALRLAGSNADRDGWYLARREYEEVWMKEGRRKDRETGTGQWE